MSGSEHLHFIGQTSRQLQILVAAWPPWRAAAPSAATRSTAASRQDRWHRGSRNAEARCHQYECGICRLSAIRADRARAGSRRPDDVARRSRRNRSHRGGPLPVRKTAFRPPDGAVSNQRGLRWTAREGLNRNGLRAVSTLRASPLRGSFQNASRLVTRAIHGARPAGAFAALRRPNRRSCRFVEPGFESKPWEPPNKKAGMKPAFLFGVP